MTYSVYTRQVPFYKVPVSCLTGCLAGVNICPKYNIFAPPPISKNVIPCENSFFSPISSPFYSGFFLTNDNIFTRPANIFAPEMGKMKNIHPCCLVVNKTSPASQFTFLALLDLSRLPRLGFELVDMVDSAGLNHH